MRIILKVIRREIKMYETIFNISYDVENSSKVSLKIYAMNESFILDYNL